MMEALLLLICVNCRRQLMQQKVSCFPGNTASIHIDELEGFAGACCERPNRRVRVEIQAKDVVIDSTQEAG